MGVAFLFIIVFVIIVFIIIKATSLTDEEKKAIEAKKLDDKMQKDIDSLYNMKQQAEVHMQAEIMEDTSVVSAIESNTYRGKLPDISGAYPESIYDDLDIIPIAGINYRGNLSAYEGYFNGVLVPEPKNDYDPNAIMIKCEDGKHIGYIPEDTTDSIRNVIGKDFTRHRIKGHIDQREDDVDGRKFFIGYIYFKTK